MAYVFVNIGSNLGDRRLNLSRAMRAIGSEFGFFEISHVVESAPWGFDSTRSFYNMGMMFQSDLPPEAILGKLQEIERRIGSVPHRTPTGDYADREIDIDIIAIDRDIVDTPLLKVPHPMMDRRRFVLVPMAELAPAWRHPVTDLTPDEMLMKLDNEKTDTGGEE